MTNTPVAAVLGRIPSGIYILTASEAPPQSSGTSHETGMLASWVMQAGFEPPMVTVAVRIGRYLVDWLTAGRPFALNVVGHEQHDLLKHFGKGFEIGQPAFAGIEVARSTGGLPVLADALGHLECQPRSHIDSGDHRIFLAEISSAELVDADTRPMVHLRKNGMHY